MSTKRERFQRQVDFEHEQRLLIDPWYTSRGFTINRDAERREWDLILVDSKGNSHKVEEKFRRLVRDDVAVELVQDIRSGSPGWYSVCRADLLNYVMAKDGFPEVVLSFRWDRFREWLRMRLVEFPHRGQSSQVGAGNPFNVFVPLMAIPVDLYKRNEVTIDEAQLHTSRDVSIAGREATVFVVRDGYADHVHRLHPRAILLTETEGREFLDEDVDEAVLSAFLECKERKATEAWR